MLVCSSVASVAYFSTQIMLWNLQSIHLSSCINMKCLNMKYKPDSKKVGTLCKLWIKTECNDVEVSNFNIVFRIQHRWHIKCLNWENVSC